MKAEIEEEEASEGGKWILSTIFLRTLIGWIIWIDSLRRGINNYVKNHSERKIFAKFFLIFRPIFFSLGHNFQNKIR